MDQIPVFSVDLIKQLDQMFPAKCPALDTPDRKIWFESGQRAVVEFLLTRLNQEAEKLPDVLRKD